MPLILPPKSEWVIGDFNGMLEDDLLCLSHKDTITRTDGSEVYLIAGMTLTAADKDIDDAGNRDDIFASGVVEVSPQDAQCRGSRWSLRIDLNGIRHESDLHDQGNLDDA